MYLFQARYVYYTHFNQQNRCIWASWPMTDEITSIPCGVVSSRLPGLLALPQILENAWCPSQTGIALGVV